MDLKSFIVVGGDPVDGFHFDGPFASTEDANDWAENNVRNVSWWVAELEAP
jgi:hypothetical protein